MCKDPRPLRLLTYCLTNMKLYNQDCQLILPKFKPQSIDAIITDIPYGIDYAEWDVIHNQNSALLKASPAQLKSKNFRKRGKPLNGWSQADTQLAEKYDAWVSSFLCLWFEVLKPASPCLVFTGRRYQHRFISQAEQAGFILKDSLVWDKQQAPFRAQRINQVLEKRGLPILKTDWRLGNLAPIYEPIVYLMKPYRQGHTLTDCFLESRLGCFNGGVLRTNLIRCSAAIDQRHHETEKPVELMTKLVKLVTAKHHVVLDPFMGSGTTGVACVKLRREFVGVERDPAIFEIARARLSK